MFVAQVLMKDPVIVAYGYTYERVAMQQWLLQQDASPVTHLKLKHTRLVSNVYVACYHFRSRSSCSTKLHGCAYVNWNATALLTV